MVADVTDVKTCYTFHNNTVYEKRNTAEEQRTVRHRSHQASLVHLFKRQRKSEAWCEQ